jgi:4-hydroxy-4-methyl-2-oxoglutarate aldolase
MSAADDADALTPEILAEVAQLATSTIHEAAGRIGALPAAIKPIAPGMRVCGPAFPVKGPPLDNLWLHYALDEARPGDVIVGDFGGHYEGGYWGEVMTTGAVGRKLGGLVVNACVRDGKELAEIGWPVFARGLAMRGTLKDHNGDGIIHAPVVVGDVIVSPGDLVLGDTDGVVVIPRGKVVEAIAASKAREAREAALMEKLKTGQSTVGIYGWKRQK